jgi:DNA ligase (NAD+)
MRDFKKNIEKLREQIEQHDYLYYVKGEPEISDEEYDRLYKELERLEHGHPEFRDTNSPTQRVGGAPLEGFRTVPHRIPMLSLDNTYSEKEVVDWVKRIKKTVDVSEGYVVEEKIDGVGLSLNYEKGKLSAAVTRGNGFEGDDITQNARTQRTIPLTLKTSSPPALVEVRGEMFITRSELERINEQRANQGKPVFANPRNTCAGTLKLLDPKTVAKRRLSAFFYGLGVWEGENRPRTQQELFGLYADWGLPVNKNFEVCRDIKDIFRVYERFKSERETRDYDIDGAVVKINAFTRQERLGATSKSPRWAVAFKFEAKRGTTRIKDIIFSVGRTGIITPVAQLEPVRVGGVTISSATLHNFDQVRKLGAGIGDRIEVERGGDVIPKITGVIKKVRNAGLVTPPKKCPVCGEQVKKDAEGVYYRCVNLSCPAQLKQALLHYASPSSMNIEGLGENVADQLVEKGLVKKIPDIYRLKQEDLIGLELFAKKKADNLLNSIHRSRDCSLVNFIFGLGIQNVGKHTAGILAKRFKTVRNLMRASRGALEKINEIGPIVSKSIVDFFGSGRNREAIEQLLDSGVSPKFKETGGRLDGKSFVFTGTLEKYSRKEAQNKAEGLGGKTSSSVSRETDFLVKGEGPGSKLNQAKKYGAKIISEDEFLQMIGEK